MQRKKLKSRWDSRRVSSKKNVIYRKDSNDDRDEIKRHSGGRTESRERQNIWNSFHDNNRGQPEQGAAANNLTKADHETTNSLELGDLMAKLDQIDKKLKHSEEDREVIKKELRYNKHEYLDNYFNLARATEEKLQQMSDKVEATDGERDKSIKKRHARDEATV